MVKILGIILIVSSIVLAYFLRSFTFPFILTIVGFLLLFINKIGQSTFNFTKLISKYPDEAYAWFQQDSHCWKIFKDQLPDNYKNEIPSKQMKPLRLIVPKIGNRMVYVFGKFPECRESEKRFIENLKPNKLL